MFLIDLLFIIIKKLLLIQDIEEVIAMIMRDQIELILQSL